MNAELNSPDSLQSLKGAAADALRPLSAIAATRRGLVPQARIIRVLADLSEPLTRLHAAGLIHGAISYDSVALNAQGEADIGTPPASFPRSLGNVALADGRGSGYNAFEQYTDSPGWAIGPWTDVYALGAVACMLVTGAPPPSAIDRCVRDTFVPLSDRNLDQYTASFLSAVDSALGLRPEDRPATVATLLAAMGHLAVPDVDDASVERDKVVTEAAAPIPPLPITQIAPAPLQVRHAVPAHHLSQPTAPARFVRQWRSWLFVPAGLGLALLVVYFWLSWSNPFVPDLGGDVSAAPMTTPAETAPPPVPPGLQALEPTVSTEGAQALGMTSGALNSPAVPSNTIDAPPPLTRPVPSTPPEPDTPLSTGDGTIDPTDVRQLADRDAQAGADDAEAAPDVTPVSVVVDVQPWGAVSINGVRRGVSPPLRSLSLAPGTYRVTISNPGAPSYSTRITVRQGARAPVIRHQF